MLTLLIGHKLKAHTLLSQIPIHDTQQVTKGYPRTPFVNQGLLQKEVGVRELLPVLFAELVLYAELSANPFVAVTVQSSSLTSELSHNS